MNIHRYNNDYDKAPLRSESHDHSYDCLYRQINQNIDKLVFFITLKFNIYSTLWKGRIF